MPSAAQTHGQAIFQTTSARKNACRKYNKSVGAPAWEELDEYEKQKEGQNDWRRTEEEESEERRGWG